jgi:hypothetical protein
VTLPAGPSQLVQRPVVAGPGVSVGSHRLTRGEGTVGRRSSDGRRRPRWGRCRPRDQRGQLGRREGGWAEARRTDLSCRHRAAPCRDDHARGWAQLLVVQPLLDS